MEIRQLEYFLTVTQAGSFTRAAERLYVSQPAITNAVRSLEEELGIQLFDRSQKQAMLTAEGRIFAAHVEQVMHGISNTLEEIRAIKDLAGGVLKIGLTGLGGLGPCPIFLKKFHDSYPNVRLEITEGDSSFLQGQLMDDKLELAFMLRPPQSREAGAFDLTELPPQELMVCASRQHRFRRKNSLSLGDLAEEKLIAYGDSFYLDLLQKAGSQPPLLTSRHINTLLSLIAEGTCLAILPESLASRYDEAILIPIEPPLFITPVAAIKSGRHLSHAAEAMLAIIQGGGQND